MNEENMYLSSYSDLAGEIKALKIGNNILKDKIKTSKQPIKVLVQWHDEFSWGKNKTDVKMTFYTGISSVSLINTVFTSINHIYHISRIEKNQNMPWEF